VTLVDTSIWIGHLRESIPLVLNLLDDDALLAHPFVIGELACRNLKNQSHLLNDLRMLPNAQSAKDNEVLELVERRKLWGRGIGWIDMHLLASALLTGCALWTSDKLLKQVAIETGVSVIAHDHLQ